MKLFALLLLIVPVISFAKIEDNSFLLEEAYNQEWGVYQFIQKYQTFKQARSNEYTFENEIPITDKVHQFSYEFSYTNDNSANRGSVGDMALNYRWQPVNKDGFLVAERFGLIVPTGSVKRGTSNGVYGFEFMQSATITLSDRFMNHWNMGFSVLPNAKMTGVTEERTLTSASAGTSFIYLMTDDFNIMLEGLLESGQTMEEDGTKISETTLTINPGFRFAVDYDWKDTQIVPGVSFPTEVLNGPTEHGVLVYLSIEPKFY